MKLTDAEKKKVNIKKIIKDLQNNFGGDNEAQMKEVQLLKGIATSDDPLSNKFMKKIDKAITDISKEVLGEKKKENSVIFNLRNDLRIGDVILERGDKIRIISEMDE